MTRSPRRFLAVALLVGAMTVPSISVSAAPSLAQLVDVRVGSHPGFDRVVFEFDGPLPTDHDVRYVRSLRRGGSGHAVRVPGRAVLQATFQGARLYRAGEPTAPLRRAHATTNVATTVSAGEFEAVVPYGVGLMKREPFTVTTLRNPSRVVVDVETTFRTVTRPVFLLDRDAYRDGSGPALQAVRRRVPAAAPATGVLHRLYAGPTPAERAAGLGLVRSRTTGFAGLTISDGTADVRLLGACSSGGATFTIANHVVRSLKAFSTVDRVVLRDRHGRTADAGGTGDSIPVCLEP